MEILELRTFKISEWFQQQNSNDRMTEGRVSRLQDRSMEIILSEEHRKTFGRKNEESPRDLWNNIRLFNIYITVIHKGE